MWLFLFFSFCNKTFTYISTRVLWQVPNAQWYLLFPSCESNLSCRAHALRLKSKAIRWWLLNVDIMDFASRGLKRVKIYSISPSPV